MRALEALKRAWLSLRGPRRDAEEPLATLFERVNEARPGSRTLLEPDVLEPETVEAVEELAAEQEARRAVPPPPARRRWAAAAAAAILVCGAGALAAVSWTVWGSDLRDSGREAEPMSAEAILAAVSEATAEHIPGSNAQLELIVAADGRAALGVRGLRRAPRGQVYEAWVIVAKPRRAALFRGGRDALVPLERRVPLGATVAVTLERAGGVKAPTNEPLFTATRL